MVLLLLLLVLTSSSCSSATARNAHSSWQVPQHIITELEAHLRASFVQPANTPSSSSAAAAAVTWGGILDIHRRLDGTGFHRTLELRLAPAAEGSIARFAGCSLSLLQPLPSSVFADPYQLEDVTRLSISSNSSSSSDQRHAAGGYSYTFELLGPLDLEL